MVKRGFIAVFLVLCFGVSFLAASLAFAASPAEPITLKFAHHNPPKGRTTVKLLDVYMEKIQAATKGKIKIVSYPAESLAKAKEMVPAIEGGVADIGWMPLSYAAGRFPLATVMTLPFMALSTAGKNSRVFQELYETIPELQKEFSSVKVLFLHTTEPYFIATSKKPIHNLNELKGTKLRIVGSYPIKAAKRLGATPVFMPMPGVYEAGQKGVIDGATLPWGAVPTHKLYEVFDYWTDVNLWLATFIFMMNLDKWNSLPPDIQQEIMSVSGVKGAEWGGDAAFGPHVKDQVLAEVRKEGLKMEKVSLDAGEVEKWKKIAGEPIWDEWVEAMEKKGLPGKKVLGETSRLMKKYE
jgi:TRAP-type C4-dicarboxylate transport system substrate-binding protein